MADLSGFNAQNVDPNFGFPLLPDGPHAAVIEHSQSKATKAGTGKYLEVKFRITDGPSKGRFYWDHLNLVNPSAEAVKFGKARLSAICRALGVLVPKDSTELHDRPLVIVVGRKKDKTSGELVNTINAYRPAQAALSGSIAGLPPF